MATSFPFPASPAIGQTMTTTAGVVLEFNGNSWLAPVSTGGGGGGGNPITINDTAPTSPNYGDRWLSPSTGEEAIWVPTTSGVGTWFVPQAGG